MRILVWIVVVGLGVAAGLAVGWGLDWSCWYITRDYVYSPAQFLRAGGRIGLVTGTVLAAAATVGARPAATIRRVLAALLVALAILGAASLAAGLAGRAWAKQQPSAVSRVSLAPLARVWFCEGLWRGAAAGCAVATLLSGTILWRGRRGERLTRAPSPPPQAEQAAGQGH